MDFITPSGVPSSTLGLRFRILIHILVIAVAVGLYTPVTFVTNVNRFVLALPHIYIYIYIVFSCYVLVIVVSALFLSVYLCF